MYAQNVYCIAGYLQGTIFCVSQSNANMHRQWKIASSGGGADQHAKHAQLEGCGGMPRRKILNFTPSDLVSGDEIADPQIKCFGWSKLKCDSAIT